VELAGKQCSRCKRFKSLGEFYQQGHRYESLCKGCKSKARAKRAGNAAEEVVPVVVEESIRRMDLDSRELESMPVFDESIFDPEESGDISESCGSEFKMRCPVEGRWVPRNRFCTQHPCADFLVARSLEVSSKSSHSLSEAGRS
jgi:hypothetical protein